MSDAARGPGSQETARAIVNEWWDHYPELIAAIADALAAAEQAGREEAATLVEHLDTSAPIDFPQIAAALRALGSAP